MTLRPATAADWDAIAALLRASDLPTTDLAPEHVDRFLVATEAGRLAGCVAVEPYGDWGLLRSLAVDSEARGLGLGGALVDAAVDRASGNGIAHLALLTETAEPFFLARGWERVSREAVPEAVRQSSEFAGGCCASAACLARTVEEGKPVNPA